MTFLTDLIKNILANSCYNIFGGRIIQSITHLFFFSSRRRHTRCSRDWSSDVCSSDLAILGAAFNPCTEIGIKTVFVKTKTSPSPSANIVDLITPIQLTLEIGLAEAEIGRASCRERV